MADDLPKLDTPYAVHADLQLSGERFVIGHSDDSVIIDTQADATYITIAEARLFIAALEAAIEGVGT
jgi:hypothetical protein